MRNDDDIRYAQIVLTHSELRLLKHCALNANKSLKDFLRDIIFEKLNLDIIATGEITPQNKPTKEQ